MDNSQRTKGTRPQDLRARNSLLILQELSQTAGQTINELSEKLHLSRTAVQNIIFLRNYTIFPWLDLCIEWGM